MAAEASGGGSALTDRPIIFSAPMVRALLDGRKTQTRRALKPRKKVDQDFLTFSDAYILAPGNAAWLQSCHGYAPGDRLWVRENWRAREKYDRKPGCGPSPGSTVVYGADAPHEEGLDIGRLRPSIHMPRWASRLTLIVESVKVERLQDMEGQHPSESDAIKEGVNAIHHGDGEYYYSAFRDAPHGKNWIDPTDAFRELWNSINGADAWAANPWVAAISFRVINANIDQAAA